MFNSENSRLNAYVNLSIEALWLARAIQDGLDVLLGRPCGDSSLDRCYVRRSLGSATPLRPSFI